LSWEKRKKKNSFFQEIFILIPKGLNAPLEKGKSLAISFYPKRAKEFKEKITFFAL